MQRISARPKTEVVCISEDFKNYTIYKNQMVAGEGAKDRRFGYIEGWLVFEFLYTGAFEISIDGNECIIILRFGVTKEEIEKVLQEKKFRFIKISDDRWQVDANSKAILEFKDNKLTEAIWSNPKNKSQSKRRS